VLSDAAQIRRLTFEQTSNESMEKLGVKGLFQENSLALMLDSRVVELRIVYTDAIPFHGPLTGAQRCRSTSRI